MRKLTVMISIMVFALAIVAGAQNEVVLDNFDTSAADSLYTVSNEGAPSRAILTDNTTDFVEGTGALDCDLVIGAYHPWGSYVSLANDPGGTQDLSLSDSLGIWIKVHEAPTNPEYMLLRIVLHEQVDSAGVVEWYVYDNTWALDTETDWFQLKVPLTERETDGYVTPDESGFVLFPKSWGGGAYDNEVLDRDKISGYSLDIVTSGWTDPDNIPEDSLVISFDEFALFGLRKTPFTFFNGMDLNPSWVTWSWGGSSFGTEVGAGATEGTNALKWVQGDEWGGGWTGIGMDFDKAYNMSGVWDSDTLKFKLKADPGTGNMRVQFEDLAGDIPKGKRGKVFDPMADGTWHDFALPLRDFDVWEGDSTFNPEHVWVLGFMAEGTGAWDQVVYIDDVWTGSPDFDVIPPAAPENLFAAPGDYSNLIVWDDVPGEEGEVYNVYYSANPIVSLEDEGLEVLATNIAENTEAATHVLKAPVTDQEVSYYYAIICKDAASNESPVAASLDATTNTAKGIVTISLDPPVGLVCDGDLSEWAHIDPIQVYTSQGALTVPNFPVDDDNDCSMDAYVAFDSEYLYIACDVTDDMVEGVGEGNSWELDRIDVFIGLYDQRGLKHVNYERGEAPDYHFNFEFDELLFEAPGLGSPYTPDSTWYHIGEKFPSGYVVETRIPLAFMAGSEDVLFNPKEGTRVPIDFSIQDRDNGAREGILTWSPNNEDLSWQTPTRWTHTWIGALWEPAAGTRGDVNGDEAINVLDVLAVVNHILDVVPLTGDAVDLADCNGDATINVLDALGIVNVILGVTPDCPGGAAKVVIYPETIEFLESLKPYLSSRDFSRFMAMVKEVGVPTQYELAQNYPNPFNPVTSIGYSLPTAAKVKLSVFNVLGQEVATLIDGQIEAGYHTVKWEASNMATGVYFYRLQAGSYVATKKCLIVK